MRVQTICIDFVIQNGLLMRSPLREIIYNNFPLQKKILVFETPPPPSPDSTALSCLHILSFCQTIRIVFQVRHVCGKGGTNLQLNCKFSRKNVYILM